MAKLHSEITTEHEGSLPRVKTLKEALAPFKLGKDAAMLSSWEGYPSEDVVAFCSKLKELDINVRAFLACNKFLLHHSPRHLFRGLDIYGEIAQDAATLGIDFVSPGKAGMKILYISNQDPVLVREYYRLFPERRFNRQSNMGREFIEWRDAQAGQGTE